jgi:hypothetical protein
VATLTASVLLGSMQYVIRKVARWRVRVEIQLKSRVAPSVAIGLVMSLLIGAIVWALQSGRNPEKAAGIIGITVFGGMFLLTAIVLGVLLARRPERMIEDLHSQAAQSSLGHWQLAKLAAAEHCMVMRGMKLRELNACGTAQDHPQPQHFGHPTASRHIPIEVEDLVHA